MNDTRQGDTSSEGGISSISHTTNVAPAISLESRDDVLSTDKDTNLSTNNKENDNLSALQVLPQLIENSIVGEIYEDRNKNSNIKILPNYWNTKILQKILTKIVNRWWCIMVVIEIH